MRSTTRLAAIVLTVISLFSFGAVNSAAAANIVVADTPAVAMSKARAAMGAGESLRIGTPVTLSGIPAEKGSSAEEPFAWLWWEFQENGTIKFLAQTQTNFWPYRGTSHVLFDDNPDTAVPILHGRSLQPQSVPDGFIRSRWGGSFGNGYLPTATKSSSHLVEWEIPVTAYRSFSLSFGVIEVRPALFGTDACVGNSGTVKIFVFAFFLRDDPAATAPYSVHFDGRSFDASTDSTGPGFRLFTFEVSKQDYQDTIEGERGLALLASGLPDPVRLFWDGPNWSPPFEELISCEEFVGQAARYRPNH